MNRLPAARHICLGWLLTAVCFAQQAVIPNVDTRRMEPQVKALIETTMQQLESATDSPDAWGQLGRVLHAHELFDTAVWCYRQAHRLDPDNFHWPLLAGHALRLNHKGEAVDYFETVLSITAGTEAMFITYGDTLTALGRFDEALQAFQAALQINSGSGFALARLGRSALLQGDIAESRALLEQAQAIVPNASEVHTLLAQIYLRLGETALAERAELLSRVHKKPFNPYDPIVDEMQSLAVSASAHALRGNKLAKAGVLPAAESELRAVLALTPGTPTDFGNLATVLARQGKQMEAIDYFEKGLTQNPNNVTLLSHQGLTLLQTGQLERADNVLSRATSLDPAYAEAQFNLGVLRYRQARHKDAIARFKRALSLNPGLTDAYLNLGSAYVAAGNLEAAIEPWLKLKMIQPDNLDLIFNIGLARVRLGHHGEAISEFEAGLALTPRDPRFASALARLLATASEASLRDGDRAVTIASTLFKARPRDPVVMELMAVALAETGHFSDAISLAERALELASENPALSRQIRSSLVLYRQGKPQRQKTPNQ